MNRLYDDYRGFQLTVYRNRNSGNWSGLGKGLGTVILPGNFGTSEEVFADMARRIDLGYERNMGVFASRAS